MSQENRASMIGWKRLVALSTVFLAVAALAYASTISATSAPQTAGLPHPSVTPSPLTIAALGDSVTAGINCDCSPFPELYAKELSTARGVAGTAVNLGVGGETSGDLLAKLQNSRSDEFAAVNSAAVDLITIGANDFADKHDEITRGNCGGSNATDCVHDQIDKMRQNITATVAQIHMLRNGEPTAVLITGYWAVFEDGDVAAAAYPSAGVKATQKLTAEVNRAIDDAAKAAGATHVELFASFNGAAAQGNVTNLLAPDGDHPNAKGQALIANLLIAAGLAGLTAG